MGNPYTKEYYESLREGALRSAEAIVPLVTALLRPRSVIDVGCGDGTWLSVFRREGVRDFVGIDREYVSEEILQIPRENFIAHDLRAPLAMGRAFDLAVSLEVAEHLPAECAEPFVDSLSRLGPAVLFSAAAPFQGGTDHPNERWPDYWAGLFGGKGFIALDPIRKHVWGRADVEYWYRQNILLFVKREFMESRPELAACGEGVPHSSLSLVHPEMFLDLERKYSEALGKLDGILADAEKSRGEAAEHRAKAEHYIAEAAAQRAKADWCFTEAQELRAKAEHCIAEAAAQRAKADWCFAEAQELRAKAQPGNISLGEWMKALPAVLAGAIGRAVKKRSTS